MIDRGQLENILGNYKSGSASAIVDPLLLSKTQDYRRLTSARLQPLSEDEIASKLPASDYFVSLKVDGEFAVLQFGEGQAALVNPGGTVRTGLPVLREAEKLLNNAIVTNALFACEFYVSHASGQRERVHDVASNARSPSQQSQLDSLHLAVIDIIELEARPFDASFSETREKIEAIFQNGNRIAPTKTMRCSNSTEIYELFERWVKHDGGEGLVARSDTAGLFKIKPIHTLDAVVVGFTESTGDREGMLHDLLLALRRTDGAFHILCKVGGGFSDQQRRDLLADLKDEIVASEYAEVNSDYVAYQMVEPKHVVEISCLDLISHSTRGAPINRMTLKFDLETKMYRVVRRLPLVSVISPQFLRLRDDKTPSPDHIRLSQVASIVEVPFADSDASQMTLQASTLMKREVYTKILKGETMVRKFVMWKTNKANAAKEFPAYVVHYTDFSPNRATPLSRDVRISNSESQIHSLYESLKEDNIKKGWNLFTPQCTETDTANTISAELGNEPQDNSGPLAATTKRATKKTAAQKPDAKQAEKTSSTEGPPNEPTPKKKAAKKTGKIS